MNKRVLEEARKLLDEISSENPAIVERVLSRLGPEAYLVKYLLAKRKQKLTTQTNN